MTPFELLMDEVKHSSSLKRRILSNVHDKKKKRMNFNVTNLIFDFKSGTVEIQDVVGVADKRIQEMPIDKLVSLLSDRHWG